MNPLLDVVGLSAGYGKTVVARDVDLQVHAGEVLAMIGPNGAGKTTLLDTIVGALPAIAGSARIVGRPAADGAPHRLMRAGVAYVPASRGLFSQLTVNDHLRLHAADRSARAAALHWFPALSDLGGRRAGLLSGGEQQMLALACALSRRPRVLLIDEMTMGLAPLIVQQLVSVVRHVADDTGAAIVIVEQFVDVALDAADDVIVLRSGTVTLSCSARQARTERDTVRRAMLGGSADDAPKLPDVSNDVAT